MGTRLQPNEDDEDEEDPLRFVVFSLASPAINWPGLPGLPEAHSLAVSCFCLVLDDWNHDFPEMDVRDEAFSAVLSIADLSGMWFVSYHSRTCQFW